MAKVSLIKFGGVCALLGAVSFIVGGIMEAAFGVESFPEEASDLEGWARNWTETAIVPGVIAFPVLAEALLVPASLAFYEALRREVGRVLLIAVVAMIIGSVFLSASWLIEAANASEVAPSYLAADESARPALGVLAFTLRQVQLLLRAFGDVLAFGVGVGLFAIASLRTPLVPTWIAWVGIVAALLGGWLAPLVPVSQVFEISGVGILFLVVWTPAMGVTMLRLRQFDDAA